MSENTWAVAAGADGFIGLRQDKRPFFQFPVAAALDPGPTR